MKTPEEFLKDNGFIPAAEIDRQAMISTFISEMEKGLKGEKSSLMMIPTYVGVNGKIPQGAKARCGRHELPRRHCHDSSGDFRQAEPADARHQG